MKSITSTKLMGTALTAVALALGACAQNPSQPNPPRSTAGQYIDDATVTTKVKSALASDAGMRTAANVNVETHQGVVQLSGFVDNPEMANRAVQIARAVEGVRSIRNDMQIRSPS